MVSGVMEKPPKLKYPKSVAFIISNEFCERFNFYGMRAILVLYLTRKLTYSDDEATVLFHVFTSLVYFFPLIGAIIADSWLGRFRTIMYLSIVYTIGSVVIAFGAIPSLHLPASAATVIGLLLIAVGTGGIKPCVSAFGGDQFKLPEQAKYLATFFSLFYLSINAGSLLSTTITPILREDVHCFGELSCYSLAFGVPGLLMVVSILIFILGKPFYTMTEPSGNMLINVSKCIVNAIKVRSKERLVKPRYHWLDYAEQKYGKQLVYDVKCLLKILILYVPLPIFWALFDQQSSRWTFQATQMNGYITKNYSIKPDQMQVLNPLIVVCCIPLFNLVIYPALEKIGIKKPLQKLTLGMVLCGAAFVVSGFLELSLEQTYPVLPRAGEGQLRIFNGQSCGYRLQTNLPGHSEIILPPNSVWMEKNVVLNKNESTASFYYNITSNEEQINCQRNVSNGEFQIKSEYAQSYFLTGSGNMVSYKDAPEKSKSGLPLIRLLLTSESSDIDSSPSGPVAEAQTQSDGSLTNELIFQNTDKTSSHQMIKFMSDAKRLNEIEPGTYFIWINGTQVVGAVELRQGGTYTIVVNQLNRNQYMMKTYIIAEPNSIHILWQMPQYIIITAGEIMFSVTGLEFSFTQAPSSMKSVLQALWLLTVTFGNILVVVIAEIKIFETQSAEFFLYAALMAFDICLFIFFAMKYKYRNESEDIEADSENRNGVVVNMNGGGTGEHVLNETFITSNGLGPAVAAIAAGSTRLGPRTSLSNNSAADEKLDASPKCLKQRTTNGKGGVDNYGYTDI